MEKKEIVTKVLSKYSCLTAREISAFAKRDFNEDITPPQVTGSLRVMYLAGTVSKSKNLNNKTVYWLV